MKKTIKMQSIADIAVLDYYIKKKDKTERLTYILSEEDEIFKIQIVETQSRIRNTIAESKYKKTALKLFTDIVTNDIQGYTLYLP